MKVGICAIMKDVYEPYLFEWLNHHRSIGVDHFFLYDNDSAVPLTITGNDIVIKNISGLAMQIQAYNKCLSDLKEGKLPACDRVAFIDEDEFIICENGDIKETLKDYADFPALGINWRVFGSSGLKEKTPEPQRKKFIKHTTGHPYERHIKSIIDPSRTVGSSGNPHAFIYTVGNCVNVNNKVVDGAFASPIYRKIWIDHYYTRSLEEWKEKIAKGRADTATEGRDFNLINEIDANCSGTICKEIVSDTYPESALAHKYCIGHGLEIGGAAHNPFGLNTLNVDLTDSMETVFKQEEIRCCGKALPVDIVANGDSIPLPDGSQDFIVSSHVFEHFPNPIKALLEWDRLLKPGGVIFMIVPHQERTFDRDNYRTPLQHLIEDYKRGETESHENPTGHDHCWITKDIVELVEWIRKNLDIHWEVLDIQDSDDKAGNGFAIVIRKAIKKNIHLIMPFSRRHLWRALIDAYRPMNVILHPLILSTEDPPEPLEDWIWPSTYIQEGGFNQSEMLNEFIESDTITDDDYYITVSDDDMYEPGVFDIIRNMDDPVVIISMKRGHRCPIEYHTEKAYPATTLYADPENIKVGSVGGEQVFMKGSVLKTIRFNKEHPAVADGFVAEHLMANYSIRYEPDLYALFNYYEPGRWNKQKNKIAFGVMVNDLLRLDMVLRQSQIDGDMHYVKNPESATKGLNLLLDIIENEGNDVAVLTHQDMYYMQGWTDQVESQLNLLPESWVLAGMIGKDYAGRICGKFQDMRMPIHFNTSEHHTFPHPACCFDECCIIVNMKSGFRFDETVDGFDLYGTLCVLQAWEMGGTAWVIDAFAEHYCMRPFTWVPDQLFRDNYRSLHDRFEKINNGKRLDSTAIGLPKEIIDEINEKMAFMTSAA